MTKDERLSLPIWKKLLLYIVSFVLFVIQLLLLFAVLGLSFTYSFSSIKWLFFASLGLGFVVVLYILHKPISTSYKLTWCILILLIPLPSMVLYLFNSRSRRLSKRKQRKLDAAFKKAPKDDSILELKNIDIEGYHLANIVKHNNTAAVYNNTKTTFFNDVELKFNDMLEECRKANHYIFIETFIISHGYLMDKLYDVLLDRGNNGVEIKIIYDDVGSKGLINKKLIRKLAKIPNCKLVDYEPLGVNVNLLINYRDHRKITIIDGNVAYCGGDNLADEYIHKKERFGYWRDNCMKYEGEAVKEFISLFEETWFMSTKKKLTVSYAPEYIEKGDGFVVPFGDGPSNNIDVAYDTFMGLINTAKEYCYISTPYFVIDDPMIQAIALKAKGGVDVRLLMPHIPDKKSVFYMSRGHYRELLKSGVKIYEYTPGFNHAKNIIVDDKYAFIGTINLDYRSLFLHYECGSLVMLNDSIKEMKEDYDNALSQSELITYDKWKKRPWYQHVIAFILNIFAPMF